MKNTIGVVVVLGLLVVGYYIYNNQKPTVVVVTPPVVIVPPVIVTPDPLTQNYTNSVYGYSMRYPAGYTVDEKYKYAAMGPSKTIVGTKFTIPASAATGTNLSRDTYISVEQIKTSKACTGSLFLGNVMATSTRVDNGITYSVAISSDAGAGNRYEETVYATPLGNSCMGIRYFVHYTVFENYPAGSIERFDAQALLDQFFAIRKTITAK